MSLAMFGVIGQLVIVAMGIFLIATLAMARRRQKLGIQREDITYVLLRSGKETWAWRDLAEHFSQLGPEVRIDVDGEEMRIRFQGADISLHQSNVPYLPKELDSLDSIALAEILRVQESSLSATFWSSSKVPFGEQVANAMLVQLLSSVCDEDGVAILDANRMVLMPLTLENILAFRVGKVTQALATGYPLELVDEEDPSLPYEEAVAEARAQFENFRAAFRKGEADENQYFVKISLASEDRETRENVWILISSLTHGLVKGKLDTDPLVLKHLKLGDEVTASVEDVLDWMYVREGQIVGGFTNRVGRGN
ncbi:MAG: DUF2314 domain-containing protein [Fimbriimonadaceae bacterium]|nr:DUF2314 domain-containing protein [Fimbriimonadaceae bacterium]